MTKQTAGAMCTPCSPQLGGNSFLEGGLGGTSHYPLQSTLGMLVSTSPYMFRGHHLQDSRGSLSEKGNQWTIA